MKKERLLIWIMLLMSIGNKALGYTAYPWMYNQSTNFVDFWFYQDGAEKGQYGNIAPGGNYRSALGQGIGINLVTNNTVECRVKITSGAWVWTNSYSGISANEEFTVTYSGAAPPSTNYYWACITLTNITTMGQIWVVTIYLQGGGTASGNAYVPSFGTWYKCITNNTPFTWSARPIVDDLPGDFPPQPLTNGCNTNSISPPGPTPNPSPTNGIPGWDPSPNPPDVNPNPNVNTNLTPAQLDRQNTAWIIAEMEKLAAQEALRESNKLFQMTNGWSEAPTGMFGTSFGFSTVISNTYMPLFTSVTNWSSNMPTVKLELSKIHPDLVDVDWKLDDESYQEVRRKVRAFLLVIVTIYFVIQSLKIITKAFTS